MKNLLDVLRRRHKPDAEALSEFVDGRGAAETRASIEAHLGECEACRSRVAALRDVRASLAAMPEAEAPRSFRLRQAAVEKQPRAAPPAPGWLRMMPALSAAAVMVFVVVLGADLATRDGAGGQMASSSRGGGASELAADAAPSIAFDAGADAPVPGEPAPNEDAAGGADDGDDQPGATRGTDEPDANAQPGTLAQTAEAAREEQLRAASTEAASDDDAGNRTAFRVVEVVTALVAITAGVGALAWWMRSREARR